MTIDPGSALRMGYRCWVKRLPETTHLDLTQNVRNDGRPQFKIQFTGDFPVIEFFRAIPSQCGSGNRYKHAVALKV